MTRIQGAQLSLRFNLDPAHLDRWVSGSGRPAGAGWPAWATCSGFWWSGGGAQGGGKSAKFASDPGGRQAAGFRGSFPGQSLVVHEAAGEAELGVAGADQPGPPVGLFGGAHGWAGPAQGVLDEPEGVFDVGAAPNHRRASLRVCDPHPGRRDLPTAGTPSAARTSVRPRRTVPVAAQPRPPPPRRHPNPSPTPRPPARAAAEAPSDADVPRKTDPLTTPPEPTYHNGNFQNPKSQVDLSRAP